MTPADSWGVLEHAAELARQGEPFALATVVWRQGPSSSQSGSRAIITADGELSGWIGGACAEPAVIREARQVIATGTARLLLLGSPDQFGSAAQIGRPDHFDSTGKAGGATVPDGMVVVPISCQSEGAIEVYVEPVLPVPHLLVVGSSPMAQLLADLARTLGWQADLIDGADFATEHADQRSMVVVATQGHHDEGVLERAVAARPAYLGLVGSAKRGAAVIGYLADRGVPRDELDRVRVPAGLDLGRTTHAEIAVAILAELVQVRASGALRSASSTAGAGAGRPATAATPGESDPVCGMPVTPGPAGLPLEHDGRTYYFCCAGCRQAFETDPAAYANRLPI
jgi:xanthine dehydrogenase accessory factor